MYTSVFYDSFNWTTRQTSKYFIQWFFFCFYTNISLNLYVTPWLGAAALPSTYVFIYIIVEVDLWIEAFNNSTQRIHELGYLATQKPLDQSQAEHSALIQPNSAMSAGLSDLPIITDVAWCWFVYYWFQVLTRVNYEYYLSEIVGVFFTWTYCSGEGLYFSTADYQW